LFLSSKLVFITLLGATLYFLLVAVPDDRYALVRTSKLKTVRRLYKTWEIYLFLFNLKRVPLSPIIDDLTPHPSSIPIITSILADPSSPDTYQKKPSNVHQVRQCAVLILLYSYYTHTVLTLYSHCTHTVLILHSYCTHNVMRQMYY
jgi:hypothetical protein